MISAVDPGMPPAGSVPITVVIIAKDEARAIERCVRAASFCDQVMVVDSHSDDGTGELAAALGAEVIAFSWNGHYPKKKQWGMDRQEVRHDWVLHLDGDEVVEPELAHEIRSAIADPGAAVAFDIPLRYFFAGRELRHGHRVSKRSLVRRSRCRFPEVGDLDYPGITEVEGHYQPECDGDVGRLSSRLTHDDPDPVGSWVSRHNKYADWEARLHSDAAVRRAVRGNRTPKGQVFDRIPGKPLIFFLYSYILKRGFLDGRAGFDYAFALTFYYWLTGVKRRELRRKAQ